MINILTWPLSKYKTDFCGNGFKILKNFLAFTNEKKNNYLKYIVFSNI